MASFQKLPQALAVLFFHSGQTWTWTMGLLLVSPGKWLRGYRRMSFWVWHCPAASRGAVSEHLALRLHT